MECLPIFACRCAGSSEQGWETVPADDAETAAEEYAEMLDQDDEYGYDIEVRLFGSLDIEVFHVEAQYVKHYSVVRQKNV